MPDVGDLAIEVTVTGGRVEDPAVLVGVLRLLDLATEATKDLADLLANGLAPKLDGYVALPNGVGRQARVEPTSAQ